MKNTNKSSKIILFDFPGQIEIFLWSISGFIITNLLKYGFKTNILFVIDVHRNVSYQPIFFNLMLSMLIVFKTRSKIQLVSINKKRFLIKPIVLKSTNSCHTLIK